MCPPGSTTNLEDGECVTFHTISNTGLKSLKTFSKLSSLPFNFLFSRNKSFLSMKKGLHRVVSMAQDNRYINWVATNIRHGRFISRPRRVKSCTLRPRGNVD
jgi:hypothetical protein